MVCKLQKIYADTLAAMGQDPAIYKEDLAKKQKRKGQTAALGSVQQGYGPLLRLPESWIRWWAGEEEISRVIQILSRRTKNNPCLVGEPGVGKTAIVEGLARRIVEGNVPDTVKNKRVLTLDLSGMIAGSKYRGEFEERIKKGDPRGDGGGEMCSCSLDELHTLIGAGGAERAIGRFQHPEALSRARRAAADRRYHDHGIPEIYRT